MVARVFVGVYKNRGFGVVVRIKKTMLSNQERKKGEVSDQELGHLGRLGLFFLLLFL